MQIISLQFVIYLGNYSPNIILYNFKLLDFLLVCFKKKKSDMVSNLQQIIKLEMTGMLFYTTEGFPGNQPG